MKEANIFEAWAENLLEGTWATPNTPEQQQELIALLSQELPVGADATNATEQLYSLVGDDILFDQLQDLAEQDPDADCRSLVIARISDMASKGFDDFDTVLDALKSEQLAPATVAPEAPVASAPAPAEVPPAPVAEQDDEEYSVDGGMNNELLQDDEEPGSCNYTAEGEHCPEHGLMECGSMYEGEQDTISRLQELSGMNNELLQDGMFGSVLGEYNVIPDPKYAHEPPAQESDPSKYAHEPPAQESDPIPDDPEDDPIPDDQGDEQDTIARLRELAGMDMSQQGVTEGLHPMIIDDVKKLATLSPTDRYSAYSNIRGYFKADPTLSKMASDLMGGYYEADMLRGKYKTAEAKAKYAELEPMNQAFIKQALGQEQGLSEDSFDLLQIKQSLSNTAEEVAVTTGNPPLGETTTLQGQYGHSGKLQTFDDVEEDVLHRLRELSGMIRS
jgi:hypothetical protein